MASEFFATTNQFIISHSDITWYACIANCMMQNFADIYSFPMHLQNFPWSQIGAANVTAAHISQILSQTLRWCGCENRVSQLEKVVVRKPSYKPYDIVTHPKKNRFLIGPSLGPRIWLEIWLIWPFCPFYSIKSAHNICGFWSIEIDQIWIRGESHMGKYWNGVTAMTSR